MVPLICRGKSTWFDTAATTFEKFELWERTLLPRKVLWSTVIIRHQGTARWTISRGVALPGISQASRIEFPCPKPDENTKRLSWGLHEVSSRKHAHLHLAAHVEQLKARTVAAFGACSRGPWLFTPPRIAFGGFQGPEPGAVRAGRRGSGIPGRGTVLPRSPDVFDQGTHAGPMNIPG